MVSNSPVAVNESTTSVVGSRIVAQIVDNIIVAVGLMVLAVGTLIPLGAVMGESAALLVFALPAILFPLAYTIGLETYWDGQTLGKKLLGIRVVTETGSTAGFGAVFVRNIPLIINLGLFSLVAALIAMSVSEKNQRLFDSAAGTAVVQA